MMKKVTNLLWGFVACFLATTSLQAQINVNWKAAGPDNISGRSRIVLVDNQNSSIIYAGSAGGGLWISKNGGTTWDRAAELSAVCVNALVQDREGTLYIGTGEGINDGTNSPGVIAGFGVLKPGYSASQYGIKGDGVYKMSNDTFVHLEATTDWKEVNRLAYDSKNDIIYAATDDGLQYSRDKGETWTQAKSEGKALNLTGFDVKACNGVVVFADFDHKNRICKAYVSNSGGEGFKSMCGKSKVADSVCRIELAIAPSDSNYIYASAVDRGGNLVNFYLSRDMGNSFEVILPGGGTLINLYNGNGFSCNSMAVFSNNPEHIIVGAYPYIWDAQHIEGNKFFSFNKITPLYGSHCISFDPKDENTAYIATNMGIWKAGFLNETMVSINAKRKNMATTQVNNIAVAGNGAIAGGTTDNGSFYISTESNTVQTAESLSGEGYAGTALFSALNTNALFFATTYGQCFRRASASSDLENAGKWFDENFMVSTRGSEKYPSWSYAIMRGKCKSHSSLSPMVMWETTDDEYATETVTFKADKRYNIGDSICVKSNTANYPMWMLAPKDMDTDDSTRATECTVIDRVQNRLFVGGGGFYSHNKVYGAPIFMGKNVLNFSTPPTWYRIFFTMDTNEQVTNLCVSEDGNYLFASTYSSMTNLNKIYRISGFNTARDSATLNYGTSMGNRIVPNPNYALECSEIYSSASNFINSISLSPYDNDVLLMTMSNSIFEVSTNATTADTNTALVLNNKNGSGLPFDASLYSAIVLKCDLDHVNNVVTSDMAMIATEEGVYYTNNFNSANPNWTLIDSGIDSKVPVLKLVQQRHNLPDVESHYYSKSYINVEDSHGNDSTVSVIDTVIVNFKGTHNHAWVYAATYGRGVFVTDAFGANDLGVTDNKVPANIKKLHIYPNPTSAQAIVKYQLKNNVNNVNISLFGVSGRKISSKDIGNRYAGENQISINCGNLPKGIYFIQIRADKQIMNGKIVVSE